MEKWEKTRLITTIIKTHESTYGKKKAKKCVLTDIYSMWLHILKTALDLSFIVPVSIESIDPSVQSAVNVHYCGTEAPLHHSSLDQTSDIPSAAANHYHLL